MKQRQNEELRAGQSLCGIHREDLELLLDDQPARVYASQGQQRSVVLSLKMAEAAAAAQITGEHPVLLLDDVLSELDEGRKQYLLTCMKEKQTFVTSCDGMDKCCKRYCIKAAFSWTLCKQKTREKIQYVYSSGAGLCSERP